MPRRFSKPAWHRFNRDRRRRYLADLLGSPPNNEQAARIESLVRIEWSALRAEAEGTLAADREAREHRRLLDRLLGDWKRTLATLPVKPLSPAVHLANRAAGRTAADILAGRGG